jgi:hypothetical protein
MRDKKGKEISWVIEYSKDTVLLTNKEDVKASTDMGHNGPNVNRARSRRYQRPLVTPDSPLRKINTGAGQYQIVIPVYITILVHRHVTTVEQKL